VDGPLCRFRRGPWDTAGTKLLLTVASCGLLVVPSAAAPTAVEIVVTTAADGVNGDIVTVAELLANPGPDGISLREAVEATNNDPGMYTIRFAPALAGRTITLLAPDNVQPNRGSLMLAGGRVTIDGDIDGDDSPDIAIRPESSSSRYSGFHIFSSGNRLHALTIERFPVGVQLQTAWRTSGFPRRLTFADNTMSNLVIRGGAGATGIAMDSYQGQECNSFTMRCPTYNRWTNTTISGNTIETGRFGLELGITSSVSDRIERLAITNNVIRLGSSRVPAQGGAAVQIDLHGNATQGRISDVLVAGNTIEGVNGDGGIVVASGLQRSPANSIGGVRILDNRIHLVRKGPRVCCFAIVLHAGGDVWAVDTRPIEYPSDNVLRGVEIARNSVSGSLAAGVRIVAGADGGASRNVVEDVRVERNVIRSTMTGKGVYLWAGGILPFEGTYAMGNRITGVTIDANRITTGGAKPLPGETFTESAGGIVLVGGWHYSRRGVVRDVRITNNRIAGPHAVIRLIGGIGPTARGNRVSCVRVAGNRGKRGRNAVIVTANLTERPGGGAVPGVAKRNRASLGGC